MRPVRQRVTFSGCVFRKLVQIIHFECEMRQIGTNLHRTALIKFAKLDFLVATWCFQEDELRSAARCVSSNLFESENILIKRNRFLQVMYAIARVQQFLDHGLRYSFARGIQNFPLWTKPLKRLISAAHAKSPGLKPRC